MAGRIQRQDLPASVVSCVWCIQAMKAQALTLLATWVVADSSHSVAGRIRKQELPARILEDLVNRAHVFLPGPHGQMAVQVSVMLPMCSNGCANNCYVA